MGKGGSIQKLILDGLERTLSSDNDPSFSIGGRIVSEKQETNTGIPFFIIDDVSGGLTGLEERASHQDGTFATIDAAMKKCASEGAVSCSVTMPDGKTYTAKGGVMIIPDSPDSIMSIREGKVTYSLHPSEGKWV